MRRRDWKLDFLKILMSIFVVLLHMASYRSAEDYMRWLPNFMDAIGRIAVPVFFMIAGANLFRRPKPAKVVYMTACKRILIPLVACSVFYIVYRYIFWLEPIDHLIFEPFRTGAFYHVSFMNRMLFLYLLAPVVQKAWSQIGKLEIATIVFSVFLTDNLMNRGFYIFFARDLYPLGYAFLGAFLADESEKKAWAKHSWQRSAFCFVVYMIGTIGLCHITMQASSEANQLVQVYLTYDNMLILLNAVSFFLAIKLLPVEFVSSSPKMIALQKVSALTFGAYLLHPALMDFIFYQRWMKWFAWDPGFPFLKLNDWQFILVCGCGIWLISVAVTGIGSKMLNQLKRCMFSLLKKEC